MPKTITKADVLRALDDLTDPKFGIPIVELGLIYDVAGVRAQPTFSPLWTKDRMSPEARLALGE